MEMDCYKREPIRFEGEIPVFSEEDVYIKNYNKISNDHLAELKKTGVNPFIQESEWIEFENSTAKHIQKYAKDGDKILDVGVGLGRTLSRFPNLDRHGVDISIEYLKETYKKGIKASLAKIEELPYKDEYFDIIVCTDVIEHMLDINLAIKNILKVLKKDGHLIVRVPYRENLAQYLTPDYPYYYVHIHNFDENSLTLFFTRVFNCEVIAWDTAGDVINNERNKNNIKYHGRFWRFYQWYYGILKKYFYSKYTNMFYKCVINIVVKK